MSARVTPTYDDYAALPDDGRRYELDENELVMTPSPRTRHQALIGNLHLLIAEHVRRQGLGEVLVSPIDVILSRITVLQPDLVYVDTARLGIVTERAIEGAPALVVEVLSPSTGPRDRGVKQALDARYGVPWYWLVDPDARTSEVLRLAADRYEAVARPEASAAALPPLQDLTLDPPQCGGSERDPHRSTRRFRPVPIRGGKQVHRLLDDRACAGGRRKGPLLPRHSPADDHYGLRQARPPSLAMNSSDSRGPHEPAS